MNAAVRVLLRRTVPWMLASFGVIAACYAAIIAGVVTWGSPEVSSVWSSAGWVLQWLAFAGGIAVGSCVPVLVAHGLSRRTVAHASAVTVLILAAGMAVLVLAGLLTEWAGYRAAGRAFRVDGVHLFTGAGVGHVHLVLVEFGLMFAAFLATGWLVYATYYRFGWWRATLALPLVFLPVVFLPAIGVVIALSTGSAGPVDPDSPVWTATLTTPVAVTLAALAVTAGLLGFRAVTRSLAVR